MSLLKSAKRTSFALAKRAGAYRLLANSRWRQQRLLILCYHGISLELEHEWREPLFMTPGEFGRRLDILQRGGYNVLPLGDAIQRLRDGRLPERSVAITFDDGNYDFYACAYPLLRKHNFPATVYLTTYYADRELPVFHLICSYVLWKRRGVVSDAGELLGPGTTLDTRTSDGRDAALRAIVKFADSNQLGALERDQLARAVAELLGEDSGRLWSKRVLQLMNAGEVAELAAAGVDFQLHTHRHRSPDESELYRRELRENRDSIRAKTGSGAVHFCYPSGVYKPEHLPSLQAEGVVSATTCDPGFATQATDPLLLPRLVDHTGLSPIEFEGWLSGAASLLPQKRYDAGSS